MMEQEIHHLLLAADEVLPKYDYLPPNFNSAAAMAEVRALAAALAGLGYDTQLDDQVQDATFFADLWCNAQGFGMRFSVVAAET